MIIHLTGKSLYRNINGNMPLKLYSHASVYFIFFAHVINKKALLSRAFMMVFWPLITAAFAYSASRIFEAC